MKMRAALLLSAGASHRYGAPKQAVMLEGRSLLGWAIDHAGRAGCDPVLVVSGAYPEVVIGELPGEVEHLHHPDWEEGMGSTLRLGLNHLLTRSDWNHCLILPTDMPWFDKGWVERYFTAAAEKSGKLSMVATAYGAGPGLPVVIDRPTGEAVMELPVDTAPRQYWRRHPGLVVLPCGAHTRDVDRPEDIPG